ncbi:MAG: CehA/McbA family metallohydrolase, partial [Deltaproteobacteria bacterium]|nr:CehA/McbA family metallohydrolase [Deltaproteobacteria bacterium]
MSLSGTQHTLHADSLIKKLLFTAVLLMGTLWAYHSHAQIETGQWYKGDLHAHSTHSDGDSPVADIIARAEDLGLNFFALTDHDTSVKGNPSHFSDPDYYSEKMVLLYGVEWTSTLGHANIWSSAPFAYQELWQANRENDAAAAIAAAHTQEALFSVNHPAASLCCPWEYPVES